MIWRKRALQILTAARMPWRYMTADDVLGEGIAAGREPYPVVGVSWTGRELIVTPSRVGSDIIHELCHWLVATRWRRSLREFGLSGAPWHDILRGSHVQRVSDRYNAREEGVVSTLDTYVHKLFDRNAWRARAAYLSIPTADMSSWARFTVHDDIASDWRWLVARHLPRRIRRLHGAIA